jgi:PPOX class probable F420-dependent enzyme
MHGLDRARELAMQEHGLAVVATTRRDGSVQASVVNAAVIDHPVTGEGVLAFVARGAVTKLVNLRARPRTTVVIRSGWDWVTVEGEAELAGPEDPMEGFAAGDVAELFRAIYAAAVGGTPDDWSPLDETMTAERHTAVLVQPARIYGSAANTSDL